jgi:hypothetical protein
MYHSGCMNVLKNIVVGWAGFFALACTAVALWFVSSYIVFFIAGYFLGGRQVSGLHVGWALIAILSVIPAIRQGSWRKIAITLIMRVLSEIAYLRG